MVNIADYVYIYFFFLFAVNAHGPTMSVKRMLCFCFNAGATSP